MAIANDILRVLRRPSLATCVLRGFLDRKVVDHSEWFDAAWYTGTFIDGDLSGLSPSLHYSITGFNPTVQPGPDFVPAEYLSLHPDARGSNPLVHYEKKGKRRGYAISYLQNEHGGSPCHISAEEHQSNLSAIAKAIGEKVRFGKPVQTVFLVYSVSMFPARPLFEEMIRDIRFAPSLVVIPDLRLPTDRVVPEMSRCAELLSKAYPFASIDVTRPTNNREWPDVMRGTDMAVYSTPYDLSDFKYNPHWSVGRHFLPVHVSYFYPISRYANWVMQCQNMVYFWRVFWENESILRTYKSISPIGGKNGVCSGSMKMDSLANRTSKRRDRKCVLVCPHCTISKMGDCAASSFPNKADFVASLPSRYPELDFIFRPHPYLFRRLAAPTVWGEKKTNEYRRKILSNPNLVWSEGRDQFDDFAESSAIIHDCGSFLAEYFYTGKPCCYVERPQPFSEFGKECLSNCYLAKTEEDILSFLDNVVVRGDDPLKESREAFRAKVMVNYPHAARAALSNLVNSFG